jgi:uncharacterized Zn-binding protein involved in type VI secretion
MPAPVRVGSDLCSGHGRFPPRPAMTGSPDVMMNDLASVRVGDLWLPHPHDGISIAGSGTVFVNDQAKVRVGDIIDCGSIALNGSPDIDTE